MILLLTSVEESNPSKHLSAETLGSAGSEWWKLKVGDPCSLYWYALENLGYGQCHVHLSRGDMIYQSASACNREACQENDDTPQEVREQSSDRKAQ